MEKIKNTLKAKKNRIQEGYRNFKKKQFYCKLSKFFIEKSFSRGHLVIFGILTVSGYILYNNFIQFGLYIMATIISWVLGTTGLRKIRDIVAKAEFHIQNPNNSQTYKDHIAADAVHRIFWVLGVDWEETHRRQGISNWPEEKKELQQQKEEVIKEDG